MNLDLGSSLIYPNGPSFPTKDCFWPRGGVLKSRGWLIKRCWKASMPWYAKLTFQSQNDEVALWQMFPVDVFFDHGSRICRNMYFFVSYLMVDLASVFPIKTLWCRPCDLGAKPPWVIDECPGHCSSSSAKTREGNESFDEVGRLFSSVGHWTLGQTTQSFHSRCSRSNWRFDPQNHGHMWIVDVQFLGGIIRADILIENLRFFAFPKLGMPVSQSSRPFFTKFVKFHTSKEFSIWSPPQPAWNYS